MKSIVKMLAIGLLAGLIGIVSITSLFAAENTSGGAGSQTMVFDVPNGIRWAPGAGEFGAFEVFTTEGFSYIASGKAISVVGKTSNYTQEDILDKGLTEVYAIATADSTYHIMNNIIYDTSITFELGGEYFTRQSIQEGGVVDGRGCTLSGFPIYDSTSLFAANYGIIRNLNIENPILAGNNEVNESMQAGVIAWTNVGTIENCIVSGTIAAGDVSIGGMAYTGGGTISNCVNKLNIESTANYVGGIIAEITSSSVLIKNCKNEGNITNTSASTQAVIIGGIVGTVSETIPVSLSILFCENSGILEANPTVETIVYLGGIIGYNKNTSITIKIDNCVNLETGRIHANSTAEGYLGGIVGLNESTNLTINYSANFGNIEALGAAKIVGGITSRMSEGVGNNALNGTIEGVFAQQIASLSGHGKVNFSMNAGIILQYSELPSIRFCLETGFINVYDFNGFSYIASEYYVDEFGEIVDSVDQSSVGTTYIELSSSEKYQIMRDIEFDATSAMFDTFESNYDAGDYLKDLVHAGQMGVWV